MEKEKWEEREGEREFIHVLSHSYYKPCACARVPVQRTVGLWISCVYSLGLHADMHAVCSLSQFMVLRQISPVLTL